MATYTNKPTTYQTPSKQEDPQKPQPGHAAPLNGLDLGIDMKNVAQLSLLLKNCNNVHLEKIIRMNVPEHMLDRVDDYNKKSHDGKTPEEQGLMFLRILYAEKEFELERQRSRERQEAFEASIDAFIANDGYNERPRDWSKLSKEDIEARQDRLEGRGYRCSSDPRGHAGWATKRAAFIADVLGTDQNPPLEEAEIEARTRRVQEALKQIKGPDGKPLYKGEIDGKPGELTNQALTDYIRMSRREAASELKQGRSLYETVLEQARNPQPAPQATAPSTTEQRSLMEPRPNI